MSLLKVPMFAALDVAYMGLVHSVAFSKNHLLFIATKNFYYLSVRKLPIPVIKPVIVTALIACLSVVFSLSAYAQVLWVHARRVVASVKNYLPFRDLFLVEKLVGVAVCPHRNLAWEKKNPIPVAVFCPPPKPASRGFFNARFKNILRAKNLVSVQRPAVPCAVVAGPAQTAGNSFRRPTFNAVNRSSGLVGHSGLHERKPIILHIHGGG